MEQIRKYQTGFKILQVVDGRGKSLFIVLDLIDTHINM